MMLSDVQILEQRNEGNIIIEPFDEANLGTNSYDVRLGGFYYKESPNDGKVFNIYDPYHVNKVWEPFHARQANWYHYWRYFGNGTAPDNLVIPLHPGETILAHTIEFIGGLHNIATSMRARSSVGRSLISVCKCAGSGDVGYINRWTMEITNHSRYNTIPLVVGRRVAQILFEDVGPTSRSYAECGKYQAASDIETIMKQWKPEMMLPRLYEDREVSSQ